MPVRRRRLRQPFYPAHWPLYPAPHLRVPGSAIAVTCRNPLWAVPAGLLLRLARPVGTVNGHPVPVAWGRTVIPVPPGRHRLGISVPITLGGLRTVECSPAKRWVTVQPGQTVELEYRSSRLVFAGSGSLGPPRQRSRRRASQASPSTGSTSGTKP